MSIRLDHLLVPSRNRTAAAKLLAELLGVPWAESGVGPFSPVYVSNDLTIDFDQAVDSFPVMHYCFHVDDASFDAVVSTFGVMFAPNQAQAASEMMRVCKRSGRIGLANWTPDGFIGQVFKTLGKYLPPPPAGAKSPALWGTRAALDEMFGSQAGSIKAEPRFFNFRYKSAEHFLEIFKTYYGPVMKAFAALDAAAQQDLHNDLYALIVRMNKSGDATMVVPSEYLEVVIVRK